jgi:hypothetical protein
VPAQRAKCSDDERRLALDSPVLNGRPAMSRRERDCPHPENLSAHEYTLSWLSFVLWNGRRERQCLCGEICQLRICRRLLQVVREFHSAQEPNPLQYPINQCAVRIGVGDGPAAQLYTAASYLRGFSGNENG